MIRGRAIELDCTAGQLAHSGGGGQRRWWGGIEIFRHDPDRRLSALATKMSKFVRWRACCNKPLTCLASSDSELEGFLPSTKSGAFQ